MPPNLVRDLIEAQIPKNDKRLSGPFITDRYRRWLTQNWNALPQEQRDSIVGKASGNPLVDANRLLPKDFVMRFTKFIRSQPREVKRSSTRKP